MKDIDKKSKISFTMRLDVLTHAKAKYIAQNEKRSLANYIEYILSKDIRSYEKRHGEITFTDDQLYKK